jgi:hypothetical protein
MSTTLVLAYIAAATLAFAIAVMRRNFLMVLPAIIPVWILVIGSEPFFATPKSYFIVHLLGTFVFMQAQYMVSVALRMHWLKELTKGPIVRLTTSKKPPPA